MNNTHGFTETELDEIAQQLVDNVPDEATAEEVDAEFLVRYEPIEVTNSKDAARAIARIDDIRTKRDAELGRYEARLADLSDRRDEIAAKHDRAIEFYSRSVETWHRAEIGKVDQHTGEIIGSSWDGGGIVSKITAGSLATVIDDEKSFMAWAEKNRPYLLNVTPAKTPIRKACEKAVKELLPSDSTDAVECAALTDDGKIIPGVTLTRSAPNHKIV